MVEQLQVVPLHERARGGVPGVAGVGDASGDVRGERPEERGPERERERGERQGGAEAGMSAQGRHGRG